MTETPYGTYDYMDEEGISFAPVPSLRGVLKPESFYVSSVEEADREIAERERRLRLEGIEPFSSSDTLGLHEDAKLVASVFKNVLRKAPSVKENFRKAYSSVSISVGGNWSIYNIDGIASSLQKALGIKLSKERAIPVGRDGDGFTRYFAELNGREFKLDFKYRRTQVSTISVTLHT